MLGLPFKVNKFLIAGALALTLVPSGLRAATGDFAIGSIIKNFELPVAAENQEPGRKTIIRGDEAIVISSNEIRIRGLSIELYRNDQVTTRIQSPESTYWESEKRLTSDQLVQVTRRGLTITSKGMEWSLPNSSGTFRENVKVTVFSSQPLIK